MGVLCLLREFVANESISDQKIDSCSEVNTDFLNLDLLASNVTAIQTKAGEFQIQCLDTEDVEFHTETKEGPGVQDLPSYVLDSDSLEKSTLKAQYIATQHHKESFIWKDNVAEPFDVCVNDDNDGNGK